MKRLLAMFLALVIALSMLPMTAFAEETLTLEEIIEETIPEETIPEETIPEETVPEETIPEEVLPEEAIPEETIPEETIPEEAIPEETIPEETIPEEVIPEETLPEETIAEENSDFSVDMSTLKDDLDKGNDYESSYEPNRFSEVGTIGSLLSRPTKRAKITWLPYWDAVDKIQSKLVSRDEEFTIYTYTSYRSSTTEQDLVEHVQELVEKTMRHTDNPKESDYLALHCQNILFNINYAFDSDYIYLEILFDVDYLTSASQESKVNSKVSSIKSSLNLGKASDYKKVQGIYKYLVRNVECDNSLESLSETINNTAYGALVKGKATSIGFAAAFYRLAWELDLDARVVAGTLLQDGEEQFAAWNVVALKEQYFYVDAAQDAIRYQNGEGYAYFLMGSRDLTIHKPTAGQFPVSEFPYVDHLYRYGISGDVNWELTDDGTVRIYGNGAMANSTNQPVRDNHFLYPHREMIKKIIIEEGVTAIGAYSFYELRNVTEVSIANSVTEIRTGAFYYCCAVPSFDLPDSLTRIGSSAFCFCSSIKELVIPSTVTSIGLMAFYGTDLTAIVIPESVEVLAGEVFGGCYGLRQVTILGPITELGARTFYGCYNLEEVILPDTIKSIGEHAFRDAGIETIKLPAALESIGYAAFYGCERLSSIEIPENTKTIGASAFTGCKTLKKVVMHDNVTVIGDSAFEDCWKLSNIQLSASLKTIGSRAFYECYALEQVLIPASVTTIKSYAFYDCSALQIVSIPQSVTTIGDQAFDRCSALKHVLYTGTKEQWDAINMTDNKNKHLINALSHYETNGDEAIISWDNGVRQCYCTICQKEVVLDPLSVENCTIVMDYYNAYTGSKVYPPVTVIAGDGVILQEGVDYTVRYGAPHSQYNNMTDIYYYWATITGKGNYTGERAEMYYIVPPAVKNLKVVSVGEDSAKITFDHAAVGDQYNILVDGKFHSSTTKNTYTVKGLTAGKEHRIHVVTLKIVYGSTFISEASESVWVRPSINLSDYYVKVDTAVYDGTPKVPSLIVKKSSKSKTALEESKDYTLSCEDNINIGKASVMISGVNAYGGTIKKTFTILPDQVQNLNVEMLSGSSVNISFDPVPGATEYWIYRNGERVKKITETSYTMTGLSAGKTYKFYVKANKPVDSENYTGTASEAVSVKPIYHLEECSLQVNYATKAYTGKSVTNTFTIKNPDGKTLKKDEDYKVTYENNKNVGTATATITGKGKYTGTLTATFDIVPPKMGTPKVKVEQLANGTALYITFKNVSKAEWFAIYLNGELYTKTGEFGHFTEYLEPGSYRVTVAAGVTIDGKDYIGAASDTVKVTVHHTVANCNAVLDQTEFIYTGKSYKPAVTVYGYNGEVLTEGVDYTLSYKNNKNAGSAYVEVKGKGNYDGSTKAYFVINPAQVTGLKVSAATKNSVKISFTKSSSNSAKYYNVYVDGQEIARTTSSSYTIKGLELGKTYDVYVIPEKTVSGTTYYGEASEVIKVWPGTYIGGYKATLEFTKATYTGEEFKPAVTVKTSSKSSATTLVEGTDYIVTYENNVAPGKAKVIIQGIGGYTGTITKTFTINPGRVTGVKATNLNKTTIQVSYDPVPGATQYWVYVGGEREVKTVDTTCTVSGLKNGKTYKITVKAVTAVDGANYSGALSETFTITA